MIKWPTFYQGYTPFGEMVSQGLSTLHDEARYPLIRLAKKKLGIRCEEEVFRDLVPELQQLCRSMPAQKVQDCFLKTFPDVQVKLSDLMTQRPELVTRENVKKFFTKLLKAKDAKRPERRYLNHAKDLYAKKVMSLYLSKGNRQKDFVDSIVRWANAEVSKTLRAKISPNFFDENTFELSEDDKELQRRLLEVLFAVSLRSPDFQKKMASLVSFSEAQEYKKRLADGLLGSEDCWESMVGTVMVSEQAEHVALRERIKDAVNTKLMMFVKEQQFEEINRFDGILESFVPATVRGLGSGVSGIGLFR